MQAAISPFASARLLTRLPVRVRRRIAAFCALDVVSSTNDYLLSGAPPPYRKFALCLARRQTAGRGRFGRSWISPAGGGVYLSAAWRAPPDETRSGWPGLMTAVALARRLREAGVARVGVKWPNDLYCGAGKLAGILIERRGSLCVAGVGVNVALSQDAGAAIGRPWATLADAALADAADASDAQRPAPPDDHVAALVIEAVIEAADCTLSAAKSAMMGRFAPLDLLRDKPVEVVPTACGVRDSFHGIARGVDEQACLRVETPKGVRICCCEEVRVRPSALSGNENKARLT